MTKAFDVSGIPNRLATVEQALTGTADVLPDAAGVHAAFKQYGYGTQPPSTGEIDLNTLNPGVYTTASSGISNLPAGWSQGRYIIEVLGAPDSSYSVQRITDAVAAGDGSGVARCAVRCMRGVGDWSSWRELQNTANGATNAEALAGTDTEKWVSPAALKHAISNSTAANAQTLDSSQFVRSDEDDTVSGDINHTGAISYTQTIGSVGGIHVIRPEGALYASNTATQTGFIKIKLPVSYTNTMMRMVVDIYDYAADAPITLLIGGYNAESGPNWVNTFTQVISSKSDKFFNVRFGDDGTNCAIYIGETTSTWSHLQVSVRDFVGGYSNATTSNWQDGWEITVTDIQGSIKATEKAALVASEALKLSNTVTIGGVSFDGTTNINLPGVNTTGNQNTTGSAASLTTARTIGGVSFDGTANINLPGVNTAGNQDTSGNAASATKVYAGVEESSTSDHFVPFVATSTAENKDLKLDSALKYRPSTNALIANLAGNVTGNADTATYAASAGSVAWSNVTSKALSWGNVQITGYVNAYDDIVDWTAPDKTVVVGEYSVHSNTKEDRIFKFRYRTLGV